MRGGTFHFWSGQFCFKKLLSFTGSVLTTFETLASVHGIAKNQACTWLSPCMSTYFNFALALGLYYPTLVITVPQDGCQQGCEKGKNSSDQSDASKVVKMARIPKRRDLQQGQIDNWACSLGMFPKKASQSTTQTLSRA